MRDAESFEVRVDGRAVRVAPGTSVAALLMGEGVASGRRSVSGEPRGPLCGMGICFECRVTVDGIPHRLGCQVECGPGMEVETDGR